MIIVKKVIELTITFMECSSTSGGVVAPGRGRYDDAFVMTLAWMRERRGV